MELSKEPQLLFHELRSAAKKQIHSQIPVGSGLGSSAAFATVLASLYFQIKKMPFSRQKINNLAYEFEKIQHGNPSGVDNTITTFGGTLWYRKESEKLKIFQPISLAQTLPRFLLVQTGKPKESTGEMVKMVREKYDQNPKKIVAIFQTIETISREWLNFLQGTKQPDISELIQENQTLLQKIGVVSEKAQHIVETLKKERIAAKIVGAGGKRSGSGMLLLYHQNEEFMRSVLQKQNLTASAIELHERGLTIQK